MEDSHGIALRLVPHSFLRYRRLAFSDLLSLYLSRRWRGFDFHLPSPVLVVG